MSPPHWLFIHAPPRPWGRLRAHSLSQWPGIMPAMNTPHTTPPATPSPAIEAAVMAINAWHCELGDISNSHFPRGMTRDHTGYDPMRYFALLPGLTPPAGRVLDHLYIGNVNGFPFLYWRDASTVFYALESQCAAEPGWAPGQDPQEAITRPVRISGSPDSCVALVLLRHMAGMAMLRSHAGYKRMTMLCGPATLQQHLQLQTAPSRWNSHIGPYMAHHVSQLPVEPLVDLSQPDVAEVHITAFTPWGGYYRQIWRMQRHGPNQLHKVSDDNILAYQCGMRF